jgi:hypothetical protein
MFGGNGWRDEHSPRRNGEIEEAGATVKIQMELSHRTIAKSDFKSEVSNLKQKMEGSKP